MFGVGLSHPNYGICEIEYVTYVEDNKHNAFFDPLIWELVQYIMSNCIKQYLGLESNEARNGRNKNMEEMTK
jgi:hypothetical protein